jgi:hypothetical protein
MSAHVTKKITKCRLVNAILHVSSLGTVVMASWGSRNKGEGKLVHVRN